MITFLVTCPKLRIYIFQKVHINISKCAKFHFATMSQWEIKRGWKFWKIVFFADVFFQKHNLWNTWISWKWESGQRSVNSKKFKYFTNTCLNLQLSKVAVFFTIFVSFRCNYSHCEIQIPFKVSNMETSSHVQLISQFSSLSDKQSSNGSVFNFQLFFVENRFF